VGAGQMGAAKATDEDVQDFGNFMVTGHGTSETQLKGLAVSLGLYALTRWMLSTWH